MTVSDLDKRITETYPTNISLPNDGNNLLAFGEFIKEGLSNIEIGRAKTSGFGISMPGFVRVQKRQNHCLAGAAAMDLVRVGKVVQLDL